VSEGKNFNNTKIYSVDLTLTDDCNFNCSYCFEHGHFNKNYFKEFDLFFEKMDDILKSKFFTSGYDLLGIGFWGGEPTLHESAIRKIVARYSDDDRVKFFIYSNGSNIDSYMDLLEEFSTKSINGHPKLCIQISYDGIPVQDICRKTKENKLTSNLVRGNIIKLYSKNIPTVTKSTITPDTFKYLPETRKDILDLIQSCGDKSFFRSSNYFPTVDYYNLDRYTSEEMDKYYCELQDSLVKISRDEIDYFRKNSRFFFAWFNPNRALCSAGRDMVCINWDGNVFKCHGSLYENKSGEHYVTSMSDHDFIEKLEESKGCHSDNFGYLPDMCKSCEATFCLKCNAAKFDGSKKGFYLEKWRDYTNQPRLCRIYKLNGRIVQAVKELLK
jgi:radical SAM protein with 4Fe4S-binding SPASM domain